MTHFTNEILSVVSRTTDFTSKHSSHLHSSC